MHKEPRRVSSGLIATATVHRNADRDRCDATSVGKVSRGEIKPLIRSKPRDSGGRGSCFLRRHTRLIRRPISGPGALTQARRVREVSPRKGRSERLCREGGRRPIVAGYLASAGWRTWLRLGSGAPIYIRGAFRALRRCMTPRYSADGSR